MDNASTISVKEILTPNTKGYKILTDRFVDQLLEANFTLAEYNAMIQNPESLAVLVNNAKTLINIVRDEINESNNEIEGLMAQTSQLSLTECKTSASESVEIGNNRSKVPASVFENVKNARNYTAAIRILLDSLFGKKILATHSLSGKPSPAFMSKKRKQPLNKLIVDDIIQIIMDLNQNDRNVTPHSIRAVITGKCVEEERIAMKRRKNTE